MQLFGAALIFMERNIMAATRLIALQVFAWAGVIWPIFCGMSSVIGVIMYVSVLEDE